MADIDVKYSMALGALFCFVGQNPGVKD